MTKCNNCGTENQDSSKFCINCGEKIIVETGRRASHQRIRRQTTEVAGYAEGKNATVSCILSLLIVGLGQFYNGDMKKGGILLGAAIVVGALTGGIIWLALAIYAAYDAYQVGKGNKQLGEW